MLEYLALATVLALAAFAAAWFLRRPPPGADAARLTAAVEQLASQHQGLAAAAQGQQRDIAALLEVARQQHQATAAQGAQVAELRGAVAAAAQGLAEVKQAHEAQRKAEAEAGALFTAKLAESRQVLEALRAEGAERVKHEVAARESIGRLEAIIAGTKSRGTAGENLLAEVIKQLPPEFRAYDVRIGGKTVEFAIPLPDGRYLPVDSKWTSVEALAALPAAAPEELPALVAGIQHDIGKKVQEVAKYLDPDKTCGMAVLAVPDAVFDLCAKAHVTAHREGVVIVPYSMAVPYVLSVLQVIKRFGARVDEARLGHMVDEVMGALAAMSGELEGRLSRSITSLTNSRDAMRAAVASAQRAAGRVQVDGEAAPPSGNGQVLVEAN